jgi:hypothetical protein
VNTFWTGGRKLASQAKSEVGDGGRIEWVHFGHVFVSVSEQRVQTAEKPTADDDWSDLFVVV